MLIDGIEYSVIGRHMRAARKQKKLSQEGVANAIGMTTSSYGKIERGHRKINLTRLAELSIALDISIEALVEGCVVAPDGSFHQGKASISDSSDFLQAIEDIAKGCSEESLRLMLQLCTVVAQEDKSNNE